METLEQFKRQLISYPGIYYSGKKLFSKLALLVETATFFNEEIKNNFPELYNGPTIRNTVDYNGWFTMDTVCRENMDSLISFIVKNPQVKITYEIIDLRFIRFHFKNKNKEELFKNIINLGD